MRPNFSVIIPSYNRAITLGTSIQSVINQTCCAWEILVVDDGSTDSTRSLVLNYPHVRYIYQENKGVSAARNHGAEEATGDWLIFLDSDDEIEENALQNAALAIAGSTPSDILIGGFQKIEPKDRPIYIPKSEGDFIPLAGSYLIRKEIFLKLGGFDESLTFSENSELFLRLRLSGVSPLLVQYVLLKYYPSDSGGSKNIEGQIFSLQRICEKHAESLSKKDLFTYRNILGVLYLRKKKFGKARAELGKAIRLNPFNLGTWGRYLLGSFPILSKQIYT